MILFRTSKTPDNTKKKDDSKNVIIVGTRVHCVVCGAENEVTMAYDFEPDAAHNALSSRFYRFHCSSCGSNVEFRIIWDWDIDKLYR